MSLVEMTGIRKAFGATLALDEVSLSLQPGVVHALVGENGSGKSTLMQILAGAQQPDAGLMMLRGQQYQPATAAEARQAGVAMIHQELALCPDLSVAENIVLGAEPRRGGVLDRQELRRRSSEALDLLGHGGLDSGRIVRSLPIGLCQIVEIARAVASGAEIIILDEPTSSLSAADVQNLFHVLRRLRAEGKAIIYISHFLSEIEEIADQVTVIRDGKIVGTSPIADITQAGLVSQMVGRPMDHLYPSVKSTRGEPILVIDTLSGFRIPIEASLALHRGEIFGIAGLDGSGRTELLRTIFGLDPVRSGRVRLENFDYAHPTPSDCWRNGAGMVSEDRKAEGLALQMSIADNITLTKLPRLVDERRLLQIAEEYSNATGVKARNARQPVSELSGGNQQKVALARLLAHDVDVLLLDEPTRGIDVGSKQQIYGLIADAAAAGKAILMTSSYLPELLGLCDRIAVMRQGMLSKARPVGELDQESIMREAVGA